MHNQKITALRSFPNEPTSQVWQEEAVVVVEVEREEVVVVMAHLEVVLLTVHLVEASTVVLHLQCTAAVHLPMVTDHHHLVERKQNSLSLSNMQVG